MAKTPDPAPDPATELMVLFPDVDIEVSDPDTGKPVALTVREFRFREGLEAQAIARPIIAALAEMIPDPDSAAGPLPDATMIYAAFGTHADAWLTLTGTATGCDVAWLARLADLDSHALTDAMWAANGGFFIRRVVQAAAARAETASLFRSLASSMRSSGPDTDADTTISPAD